MVTLSKNALEFLAGIILGNTGLSPERSAPELAEFFQNRAEWEPFGHGFPQKDEYVKERLNLHNGGARMAFFVERAFQSDNGGDDWVAQAAARFSEVLAEDGYEMRLTQRPGNYLGSVYTAGMIYYALSPLGSGAIEPAGYSVTVIDNFHRHDPTERQIIRGFASEQEATSYGLARVRSSIEQFRKSGDDRDAHFRRWMAMGEEVLVNGARLGMANFTRFHEEPATAEQCDWVSQTPPEPKT